MCVLRGGNETRKKLEREKKKKDHITSLFIATDSGDDGRHVDPAHTTTPMSSGMFPYALALSNEPRKIF